MTPPKKRTYPDLPDYLTYDSTHGLFRYQSPITGERRYVGSDYGEAVELAKKANRAAEVILAQRRLVDALPPTVADVIALYELNVLPNKPWSENYRKDVQFKLEAIRTDFGHRPLEAIDRIFLGDWVARFERGDTYMKWRAVLVDVWTYAVARKLVLYNEAAATMPRTTSQKLAVNRKQRRRLTVDAFWAIHEHAPPFLQIAMELSLVTLQSRAEICDLLLDDRRDGWLYFIRDKTAGDTEKAFIRIQVTPQIDEIIARAMSDDIHTPYVVHYKPKSKRRQHLDAKPHWTYVMPKYLTDTFKFVRDARESYQRPGVGVFDNLTPRQRPTFHEIRSLGSRIYRELGYPKEYVNALLGHADEATTDIYLRVGRDGITDNHYQPAHAEMNLKQLPKI